MGIMDKIRGKTNDNPALLAAYANSIVSSNNQSASEAEMRKELEINIHMIEDEGLLKKLDALSIIFESYPMLDKEGTPIFDKATGKPILIEKRYVREWALALRVYASKVLATRWMDRTEAEIAKLQLDRDFLKIKRSMDVEERAVFSVFVDSVKAYCRGAIDDCIGGRKGLLLKVSRKSFEVGLNSNKTKSNVGGQ